MLGHLILAWYIVWAVFIPSSLALVLLASTIPDLLDSSPPIIDGICLMSNLLPVF